MPEWFSVPLIYGMPLLVILLSTWVAARIRSMSLKPRAGVNELRIALRAMDEPEFASIARACGVNPPPGASRGFRIARILQAAVRFMPGRRAERRRLEALIRDVDGEALPNVRPARLKFALKAYFTQDEQSKMADAMGLPAKDLFSAAKKVHRLAELEQRMRAIHPTAL